MRTLRTRPVNCKGLDGVLQSKQQGVCGSHTKTSIKRMYRPAPPPTHLTPHTRSTHRDLQQIPRRAGVRVEGRSVTTSNLTNNCFEMTQFSEKTDLPRTDFCHGNQATKWKAKSCFLFITVGWKNDCPTSKDVRDHEFAFAMLTRRPVAARRRPSYWWGMNPACVIKDQRSTSLPVGCLL